MPQVVWMEAERKPNFPDTANALQEPNGLLAAGGQLNSEWLLFAYKRGIFPWYSEGEPIMWWSPSPRMTLIPGTAHVSRSLKKFYKKARYTVRVNHCFDEVIDYCSDPDIRQEGTWITEDIKNAYKTLHKEGWAHSVEIYDADILVGGLYGIGIDKCFFGESMFSLATNASKLAFIALSELAKSINLNLIDCQLHNPYLESLGATLVNRTTFEKNLPLNTAKLKIVGDSDLQLLLNSRLLTPR